MNHPALGAVRAAVHIVLFGTVVCSAVTLTTLVFTGPLVRTPLCGVAVAEEPDEPTAASRDADPAEEDAAEEDAAATPRRDLGRIVVSATLYPAPVGSLGSSVSVVEEEEIEKRTQVSVLELLRTLPGVDVVQGGGRGATTSVLLRGAESDQTLVLIDGVRANTGTAGGFDFADIKADGIERIEVLRGPQSVLYGSDAIGGVINIITRRGEGPPRGELKAEAGSKRTQHYRGSFSFSEGAISNATSLSFLETAGISTADEDNGNDEADRYDNISASTRIDAKVLDDGEVSTRLRFARSEVELDGFEFGIGAVDDPNAKQERDLLTAAVVMQKPVTTWLTPVVELGLVDDDLKGTDPDTEFNNFTIDNRTLSSTARLEARPIETFTALIGAGYEQRDAENLGVFDEDRDMRSVFVQNQALFWQDRVSIIGGARWDDDSAFGDETTFRLVGSVRLPVTETRLHASFGTGFKAPTFNELFFPNFGNPDLDAETSRGFDVGVEQSFLDDALTIDVTYFENDFDDLITFSTETFLAENIDEASTSGIEASLRVDPSASLSAIVSYTYLESENEQTGMRLARRPRHKTALTILADPMEKIHTALTLTAVNDQFDTTGEPIEDYERVDAVIKYEWDEHVEPFIRVENLLGENYQQAAGFGSPGLQLFAGLHLRL